MNRRALTDAPLLLMVLLSAPLARGVGTSDPQALAGSEILAQMERVYATCGSYRDSGVVRIVYVEETGERVEERPFKTAFVRPDSFRFEFTQSFMGRTTRYIVWQRASEIRTWWDVNASAETPPSLDMGLAGATGVSGGSAHTVPVLLLPGVVTGRSTKDMTVVTRLSDVDCGSSVCSRVEGVYAGRKRTLWIDLKSYLLRRVEFSTAFPKFHTQETTTYEPAVDETIPMEVLEFNPPHP